MLNALIVIRQSFKVTNKKLLKSYTKILEKISNLMDIKIDCEPVYTNDDKYVKTKIKIYKDKVNTNLEGKKILKEMLRTNVCH